MQSYPIVQRALWLSFIFFFIFVYFRTMIGSLLTSKCVSSHKLPNSFTCARRLERALAELCIALLWFFPQIVQTNRSRLPGASAVTSPIHSSLDACQPGAERAVSIATTNNRLASHHSPPFTCAPRNPENKLVSAHLSLKTSDAITAPRTCKLPLWTLKTLVKTQKAKDKVKNRLLSRGVFLVDSRGRFSLFTFLL